MAPNVRVDLHVHTARYSPCAEAVDPSAIADWAERAGLAGVVITDHDVLWPEDEMERLQEDFPAVAFYRGIEVTSQGCHLVVVGLDRQDGLRRGTPVEDVVSIARTQGAAVILAHPYRDAEPDVLPLGDVDAVEVGSTSFTRPEAEKACALARRLGKPVVASSDAHALSRIGWAYTVFPRLPADEKDLAAMVREGLGRPATPHPLPEA